MGTTEMPRLATMTVRSGPLVTLFRRTQYLSAAPPERQIWAQEPEIRPHPVNAQHPS